MDIKPMQRDIKLIVIDLDGTLLNDQHKMTKRNRDAIKKAITNDIRVVLATGKTRTSAEGIIKDLGFDSPGRLCSGLDDFANADGTIRKQNHYGTKACGAKKVINYAENNGFEVMLFTVVIGYSPNMPEEPF
ncbi:MAG: HAD hydrolase family protein [Anaerolineae bacterium]|nr:HAD hydrolase family protein [Anaerolineae bacterium]